MGTRSLTVFNDSWNDEEIAVFYRQFDGYPAGHGRELFAEAGNGWWRVAGTRLFREHMEKIKKEREENGN